MKNILKYIKKMFLKYNSSIQRELFLSFVLINMITMTLCLLILYMITSDILTKTNKDSNIKEFQQISYNLGVVTKEVTNIIDVLSTSSQLQNQKSIYSLSEVTNVINTKETFYLFSNYLEYYPYIESIYCYMGNETIIGKDGRSNIFLSSEQMNLNKDFFSNNTDFLKKLLANNNFLISEGGFTSKSFNYSLEDYTDDTRYITFAKSFRIFSSQPYVILVNINEDYFRSLYNMSGVNNSSFLINNSGKIISHPDSNLINKISASYISSKILGEFGSYYYNGRQIVYCHVPNSSFILIRETNVNDIIKNVLVIRNIFLLVLFLNFIFIFLFSKVFIQKIIRPLNKLSYSMYKIEQGNFTQTIDEIPNNEIGILNKQFNKMSSSILELLESNKAIEEEKRKIEIDVLQAQINPHFLYNTLNTLKWMAVLSNANNVAEGLTTMGNLLRNIYCNKGALWSIKEEYDFIQNYIKIMNYRYGGGIFVTVLFPEEFMEYTVLTFMLQPILENSFTHGLKVQGNSGEISVKISSKDEDIYFEIKDNGEGMSEEKLKEIQRALETDVVRYGNNGMSISNVNRRIKLNYGEGYGIHITSTVRIGTTVIVKIPKIKI